MLLFLKDKKDLGIHSEMFSDGVVELIEAGVVTNARKTLHPGKSVVSFLMGTKRLYHYVAVSYTHLPRGGFGKNQSGFDLRF